MAYDWTQLGTKEITNLYLYGEISTPSDLTSDALLRPKQPFPIDVEMTSFMTTGPGRFALGPKSDLVSDFMMGLDFVDRIAGTRQVFSKTAMVDAFRKSGVAIPSDYGINIQQMNYDDLSDDWGMRAYIWGSGAFQLGDDVRFVIEADGTHHIENYSVIPRDDVQENFDFEGGLVAQLGNYVLESLVDPSKIGHKVLINFVNDTIQPVDYTLSSYAQDVAKLAITFAAGVAKLPSLLDTILGIEQDLWDSGVTKFLDSSGNPILYGSIGNDNVKASDVFHMPNLFPHASNITIITGEGNDVLTGGFGNDKLIGGKDNDNLIGGAGTDTYIIKTGDGIDTLIDAANDGYGGDGLGKIVFDGQDLSGSYSLKDGSTTQWGDATWTFEYIGQENGQGLLTISKLGGADKIVVPGFSSGKLGITLNGAPDPAPLPPNTHTPIQKITTYYDVEEHPFLDVHTLGRLDISIAGMYAEAWGSGRISGDDNPNYLHNGDGDDELVGNGGSDILVATAGNDTLNGGLGADALAGGAGDDLLDGGDDNDVLSGGIGKDVLSGGAGNDILFAGGDTAPTRYDWSASWSATPDGATVVLDKFDNWPPSLAGDGADCVDGGAGDDMAYGGEGDDYLLGGDGADVLAGESGDDILDGGDGDDRVSGDGWIAQFPSFWTLADWHGDDYLTGGAGSDKLWGDGGADELHGGLGDDQLVGDNLQLPAAYHDRDTLYGEDGADLLFGNGGDDLLDGGRDADELTGGAGADSLAGGDGSDKLWGDGADVPTAEQGADMLDGGDGDDYLEGNGGDDTLLGGKGIDQLLGDIGADLLDGGDGDDTLEGGDGDDSLAGGAGNDGLVGGAGVDRLDGGDGNDILQGGEGGDSLQGGAGADLLQGGAGDDTYAFAAGDGAQAPDGTTDGVVDSGGTDTVRIEGAVSDVWLTPDDLLAVQYGAGDLLAIQGGSGAGVENFEINGTRLGYFQLVGQFATGVVTGTGANGAAVVAGGRDGNAIAANDGNTQISGGQGDDSIAASGGGNLYRYERGDGNDTITDTGKAAGAAAPNQLIFGAGIALADIALARSGNDLVASVAGGGQVTIAGYYPNNSIDSFMFADGTIWDAAAIAERTVARLTEGADNFTGTAAVERIDALGGDDLVHGQGNNDDLSGGSGSDILWGEDGDDTLAGDAGNDTLRGGLGGDTYSFAVGDGNDTIVEGGDAASVDRIRFAEGIAAADVAIASSGSDLVISVGTESLTVVGAQALAATAVQKIELVEFADGTLWDAAEIQRRLIESAATAGNDSIVGGNGNDTIHGLAGSDDLKGQGGADALFGDAGDDFLSGGDGDDALRGGPGYDMLNDGPGSDTVFFGRGEGEDRWYCLDNAAGAVDVVVMDGDVSPADVQAIRLGHDLILQVASAPGDATGTDKLNLYGYFSNNGTAAVDEIRFADGTVWRPADFFARELNGGDGDDARWGFDSDDSMHAGMGNDSFYGGAGNDTVDGGGGNDQIWGEAGNDMLVGGAGDDMLYGAAGADSLYGGAGSDTLDGGSGGDTYGFGRGDGQDTIAEGYTDVSTDTLALGAGITAADVALYRNGNDLLVVLDAGPTQVKVRDFFWSSAFQIERILFADGTAWSVADINSHLATGSANAMTGTAGNDTFVVDNTGDTIAEGANQGVDTVESNVTWTLGANLENLTLTGFANINGTGNALANTIVGNGNNNRLDGGGGDDTLRGGDGDDTYVLSSGTDSVVELAGEGIDTVIAYGNYTLGDHVENLSIQGTSYYPAKATGNALDNVISGRYDQSGNVLDGAAGADTLIGGIAGATFVVDNVGDRIVTNGGTDYVQSHIDWTLGEGLENLELLQDGAATAGVGNALNNILKGNQLNNTLSGLGGNDTFYGGAGNDIFVGGDGDDRFYLDTGVYYYLDGTTPYIGNYFFYPTLAPEDTILEQAGGGTDTVVSIYDYVLGDHLENLVLSAFKADSGSNTNTYYAQKGTGNGLNNTLTGNDGNNILDGGLGADTLKGGAGNDTYHVDNAGDVVEESASGGTDLVYSAISHTLAAHVENLALTGAGNDAGSGNALNNRLDGSSSAGANLLAGGLGDDTYILGAGDTAIEADGAGSDTIVAAVSYVLTDQSIENLTLSGAADIDASGNALDNVLTGNSGGNRLAGGSGNDTYMFGRGGGQDRVVETDATAGNLDRIVFSSGVATADVALAREGNDLVALIAGTTDRIAVEGFFGAAIGVGIEEIRFADESTVWTRAELELRANNQAPALAAPLADIIANVGATSSYSVPADAFVDPNPGDSLTLSAMLDNGDALPYWLSFDPATGGFNIAPVATGSYAIRVTATDGGGETVSDVFDLTVIAPSVTLTGTSGANTLTGGAGDDTLYGLGGNDTLKGMDGNDTLDGGTGSDSMQGGAGDDYYIVNATGDKTTENLNAGWDAVQAGISWTLASNVEELILTGTSVINGTGNTLDNMITGNAAANKLTGNGGNDELYGMGGNDTLNGNAGSDYLEGGTGNDSLTGGTGDDYYLLARGYGTDTIVENDSTAGNNDQAIFAADIAAEQLWFRHVGSNLEVSIIGTADKFVFKSWYSGTAYRVEEFDTDDGRVLYDENVEALVQAMAGLTMPALGQTALSASLLATLAPTFESCWG